VRLSPRRSARRGVDGGGRTISFARISIRLRLTLLYTAVLATTLLVFGVAVYAIVSQNQRHDIDASLLERAQRECPRSEDAMQTPQSTPATDASGAIVGNKPGRLNGKITLCSALRATPILIRAGKGYTVSSGDNLSLVRYAAGVLSDPSIFEQIVDSKSDVVVRSGNLEGQTLPQPGHPRGQHFETIHLSQGADKGALRVLVWPIPDGYLTAPAAPPAGAADPSATQQSNGVRVSFDQAPIYQPPLTLLLARSLNDVNSSLARLEVALIAGSLVCIAAAAGVGWLLARNALLPIDRLTAEAQRIGKRQDFARRVRYTGPSDEVGRLAGTFNTMLDSLEEAFARQARALEAQKRFVADASHELRTPLTTIRGNVELLRLDMAALDTDQREALTDVAGEAERMSRLVANLLELARADAGLKIKRAPVEAQPVIDEVLARAARRAPEIAIKEQGTVEAIVQGDRDYLVQLLTILIDNALKYTPRGGRIEVASSLREGTLRIAVSDTGPGISPEHQAHIFDRFYRADPSRHGEGTGLGLAIARWIALELGGDLVLESVLGAGSTFTVSLPALQGAPSPELVHS
jgi:two-component system, OmpR family, sensor kinase